MAVDKKYIRNFTRQTHPQCNKEESYGLSSAAAFASVSLVASPAAAFVLIIITTALVYVSLILAVHEHCKFHNCKLI